MSKAKYDAEKWEREDEEETHLREMTEAEKISLAYRICNKITEEWQNVAYWKVHDIVMGEIENR